MRLKYHRKSLSDGSETDILDNIHVENTRMELDYGRLGQRWAVFDGEAQLSTPSSEKVNFVFNIANNNTTVNYQSYISSKPSSEPDVLGIGGETMAESQDKTWEIFKNCDVFLSGEIQGRLSTVLEALVSERQQRLGGDNLSALFSLYSEGKLETSDVLRIGNVDLYQFREYLNAHNIPYRYEEDYSECLDDYKDLL